MRILVTGAAGFIGQHLVYELARRGRHNVVVTDKEPLDDCAEHASGGFRWDIRDHRAIDVFVDELAMHEETPDALIHLAAIAAPRIAAADPTTAWETNVRGTFNILTLAQRAGVKRVLFFSSAHVYGISPKYLPTDETAPLSLHDPYTVTKILGEELCERFWTGSQIQPCVFRLFNCYGPGQNPDYFLGAKLAEATAAAKLEPGWHGRDLLVKGADITKDWIHVSDVVRAARLAVESKYVGAFNVGTGIETNLGTLGLQIAEGFGLRLALRDTDDPGPTRMRCDPTRIEKVLDWKARVKVTDGLADLIERAKLELGAR